MHTSGTPVRENEVVPTIINTGSYDEVMYCSVCHSELSRTGRTIPVLRSGTCGTNIRWTVTENSASSFALSVGPAVLGQPAVITDIPWDDCRENIAVVTLETGITGIGDNAFSACTNISSVVLPGSVQSIGSRAFNGCSGLKTLELNDGLLEIGSRIIEDTALTELSIPESLSAVSADAFTGFGGQLYAALGSTGAKAIGNAGHSFRDRNLTGLVFQYVGERLTLVSADSTLRTADIPHGVTHIGAHAFENNTRLSSVTLPGTLKEIGDYAFYSCSRLNDIQLPYGLTKIGQYAFYSCLALKSLPVPYSVTDIGTNAFGNCSSLTLTVYEGSRAHVYATQNYVRYVLSNQGELVFGTPDFLLPAALAAIEDEAFMGISASCIELPNEVQYIENSAFEDCRQLKQIYIPASVTYISPTAFNGTSGLVIFGAAGSYADDFAYDYGFTFAER